MDLFFIVFLLNSRWIKVLNGKVKLINTSQRELETPAFNIYHFVLLTYNALDG